MCSDVTINISLGTGSSLSGNAASALETAQGATDAATTPLPLTELMAIGSGNAPSPMSQEELSGVVETTSAAASGTPPRPMDIDKLSVSAGGATTPSPMDFGALASGASGPPSPMAIDMAAAASSSPEPGEMKQNGSGDTKASPEGRKR